MLFCIVFLAASLLPRSLEARTLADAGHPHTGEGVRTAVAVRVQRPPRLDGTLNDPLWQRVRPITDFRQREPNQGQLAAERTEVRIVYTRSRIYFGIRCYEDPKKIVATQLVRDASQDLDDYFQILIDPTNNHRDAYVFQFNPLGTKLDGTIVNEGQLDTGWNGIWYSEAHITDDGWTATIAIPFSTLNFMKSKNVAWGLNFERFIRWSNEQDLWSAWQRAWGITKVSQAGELTGISDIGSGRLFIVTPYGLTGSDSKTETGTHPLYTGGLDIKYGLRSNVILDLTGNTDFAEAEADQLQFNLTPYKLFIPETRRFFLENAGIFSFPMGFSQDQLFFSRQIGIDPVTGEVVPINGGAKLTGELGKYQFGAMDVDTRSSGPNPYANYAVVSVKRSLFGDSYVGFLGTDKRSGNPVDDYNQAGGVDTRLVFLKNLTLQGWATQTRSPGISSGNTDVGGSLSYVNNWMQFNAERVKIGPNFNPEVGFVERTDSNESFLDLNLAPHVNVLGLRELNFEGFIDHIPDTEGVLQTQEWQGTFRALWNNGAYTDDDLVHVYTQRITTPFNIYKNIYIPPGMYHFVRHQFTYGSPQNWRFGFNLNDTFGGYYGGTLNYLHVGTNYRPSPHFSMTTSTIWNRFRLPEGKFSVVLAALGANYSFTRFVNISSLIQMDTANTQAVNANIIFHYRYRPFSDIYVIYLIGTQFQSLSAGNPQQLRESRLEVKVTYSFFR